MFSLLLSTESCNLLSMTSLGDVPLGAGTSFGRSRQLDALVDNESPYDQFEMSSFTEYLHSSETSRHNADFFFFLGRSRTECDTVEHLHETYDAESVRIIASTTRW